MKSIFKKSFVTAVLAVGALTISHAQVKIGDNPATINPSAALEIESTNKGFLGPRVSLQSATDATTISSPAKGLLVYNNNAALSTGTGQGTGYYYNDGTSDSPRWIRFASGVAQSAKAVGPAGPALLVQLGDFEFRYSATTNGGFTQFRSIDGQNRSYNVLFSETFNQSGTQGYSLLTANNLIVGGNFVSVFNNAVGGQNELNTFYVNLPLTNEVYRVTFNLIGNNMEVLLVEKF
ncbi:hypothetical protein [Dyadobacter diqingensis]|uniref:hypothetical protein n=1 Tax=Dyadobacter diqingensis TaxID=2938121 RepID=UPI0020C563CA|nr:hypothetical protein [Dyadobacter diqingensis]